MEKLNGDWFHGKNVMDVGCGDGSLSLLIAARFNPKQLIGVDIDHRLCTKALKNMHDCINQVDSLELIADHLKNGQND